MLKKMPPPRPLRHNSVDIERTMVELFDKAGADAFEIVEGHFDREPAVVSGSDVRPLMAVGQSAS